MESFMERIKKGETFSIRKSFGRRKCTINVQFKDTDWDIVEWWSSSVVEAPSDEEGIFSWLSRMFINDEGTTITLGNKIVFQREEKRRRSW